MDNDKELIVKVTRLRRRLSTEAEGTQSPATPSTPTKKRATKLVKPALELIDENVTETVPKRITRKSIARETVEQVEEKVLTPSRRSARIRSNTSLVLEASQNVLDSPRARRATRRNSQIGSDTETTTTPAKQNRRARKDSTSSVEKLAVPNTNEKILVQVAEVITEEPEKEIAKDPKVENTNTQSPTLRKSPRLNKKGKESIDEAGKNVNDKLEQKDKSLSNTSTLTDENSPGPKATTANNTNDKSDRKLESNDSGKENLSLTSANLIHEIESKPKKSSIFSKTTTEIEKLSHEKTNRKRTKSWTTITSHLPTEDNDQNKLGFGDGFLKNDMFNVKSLNKSIDKSALVSNSSTENKENINFSKSVDVVESGDTLKLLEKTPSKNIQSVVFIEDSDSNSGSIGKLTIDLQNNEGQHNNGDDQCVPIINQATSKRSVSESFTVEPMDIDETIPGNITINDFSDKTNSSREEDNVPDSKRKSSISDEKFIDMNEGPRKSKRTSSISLQQESNNSKRKSSIGTSEEYASDSRDALNKFNKSSLSNKSQRKSSLSVQNENGENLSENVNTSKRKSSLSKLDAENNTRKSSVSSQAEDKETVNKSKNKSVSNTEAQNLEKSSNENKSTLVLSQLKDVSANEVSNVSKSPNDTNNELSKSVNILGKETGKKSLSLNLLTSTPLQQKPKDLQKIAMQINTSVISHNAASKNTSKVNKTKSPKKNDSGTSHNSDSSSDEDSMDKIKLIDDEAEEASDNYESGDSRNDEEKQYEFEHEIREKGETLESEQEFSNDSDYEKDSFIVSSDEEDDYLLSGSGDDLSLSDNELKMTAKSKKKFDERKRKEQKKSSKEMYQARHNLNESDKSSKTKKPQRQRLDSSVLELAQPKKKNRLRIDSSQDASLNNSNTDESICVIKKKVKRLSESVCELNVSEKEISICNQSVVENNDPLSVAVKLEPKTPQKELNVSAVLINDNIEEVQMDTDASVMKSNETSDPLHTNLVQGNEESDSDFSENMEIKENYDSVLEILNKTNNKQKKVKTIDTSLNLNKKTKDKVKEPIIVDQLNLTKVKKSKKNKAQVVEENETNEEPQSLLNNEVSAKIDESETSDSIDMRLLFPEDSNDSEANAINFKPDENQVVEPEEQFVPLKRTEAKTNIHESIDLNDSELNVNKNKKRKSAQGIPEATNDPEDTNISFFIDTKGTYEDMDIATQSSAKKNKKKYKQNLSVDNDQNQIEAIETLAEISGSENAIVNVSQKSEKKKKKKNKSFDVSQTNLGEEPVEPSSGILFQSEKNNNSGIAVNEQTSVNVSLKSEKKKKKKNKSFDVSQTGEESVEPTSEVSFKKTEETEVNTSLKSDKKKKKNKSSDVSLVVDNTVSEETPINVSLSSDKKKKKKNKSFDTSEIVDNTGQEPETPIEVLFKTKKKNKSDMTESAETSVNVSTNSDKKKKKNKSHEISHTIEETVLEETENVSQESDKKKKKKKSHDISQIVDNPEDSDEAPVEVSYKSEKHGINIADPVEDDNTLTSNKNKFKKKKKKNKIAAQPQTGNTTVNTQVEVMPKKRKLDVISAPTADGADGEIIISKSQKKKRKISENREGDNAPTEEGASLKSKKRKAEDENNHIKSKVFKENSFDKIHVPRLPESIINQLGAQLPKESKKQKKVKAISTVPFEVEEAKKRKNKPSNYLEQSIYLNDSPVKQKQKYSIKNPKVLPFIPTAITSGKGYTSRFRINVLPQETEFIAQASNISNFKNEYLSNQRIKKLGTFERFKRQRNHMLSKF